MGALGGLLIFLAIVVLILVAMGLRIVQEYERGIVFRLGRVRSEIKRPGLNVIIPQFANCAHSRLARRDSPRTRHDP